MMDTTRRQRSELGQMAVQAVELGVVDGGQRGGALGAEELRRSGRRVQAAEFAQPQAARRIERGLRLAEVRRRGHAGGRGEEHPGLRLLELRLGRRQRLASGSIMIMVVDMASHPRHGLVRRLLEGHGGR